jgi:hypothetical protein
MVELTIQQKVAILNYYLGGADKGLFESVEEFQIEDVEDKFDEYMDACDAFIEHTREQLIAEIEGD